MRHCWSALLLLLSGTSQAAWYDDVQWTLYAGVGTAWQHSLIKGLDRAVTGKPSLSLLADLEYQDFFLESLQRRQLPGLNNSTLGYRLWQQDGQSLAIIASNFNGVVSSTMLQPTGRVEIPELAGISERRADYLWGLRYTSERGAHYWSLELGKDLEYHYGMQSRLFYSYRQMVRNWDLYYNLGWSYANDQLVDYYYGVRPHEVRPGRPMYQAGAGHQLQAGFSAVYPLTTDWLLEFGSAITFYSSAYSQSPLTQGRSERLVLAGARYVF